MSKIECVVLHQGYEMEVRKNGLKPEGFYANIYDYHEDGRRYLKYSSELRDSLIGTITNGLILIGNYRNKDTEDAQHTAEASSNSSDQSNTRNGCDSHQERRESKGESTDTDVRAGRFSTEADTETTGTVRTDETTVYDGLGHHFSLELSNRFRVLKNIVDKETEKDNEMPGLRIINYCLKEMKEINDIFRTMKG